MNIIRTQFTILTISRSKDTNYANVFFVINGPVAALGFAVLQGNGAAIQPGT